MRWAALIPKEQRRWILNQRHIDWPWGFRWVPRAWTSWLGDPPRKLKGNAAASLPAFVIPVPGEGMTRWYPKPIPDNGQWWLGAPVYFAIKTAAGWYFRIGFRWDDVDRYYALSTTLKRYR